MDVFLDRTRAVTELMERVGGGALGRVPEPLPSAVTRMLASLRQLAEQAPPLTSELHVLMEEVHAKRLSIQALQAELSALDHQLEVLERAMAPVQAWTRHWERLQSSLVQSIDLPKRPRRALVGVCIRQTSASGRTTLGVLRRMRACFKRSEDLV